MLDMDRYSHIRTSHRLYGVSIRELVRTTGHSRNTIRRVLRGEYEDYGPRSAQSHPVLGEYHGLIDEWLESDKEAPKKQRHTAKRVYDRLVSEEGFRGSKSNVRRYVREAKVRLGLNGVQAFVPLDPECGQSADVDWGTATVVLGGVSVRVKFFCLRSRYSGKYFARYYPCERQQALFDAHMHAWSFLGGIFPVHVYDNLTTAVKRVLVGRSRKEQEEFTRFRGYYSFEARFCNRGQGNEKGGVENQIGFVRRNHMVPLPEAATLEELNERLLLECVLYDDHRLAGRDRTVNEFFEEEKSRLLSLPEAPFSNIHIAQGKVDKYSTVVVDKNRYSVPTRYGGYQLNVELSVDRVTLLHQGKRIARHRRLFGNNKWCLEPDHYLDLLLIRPRAFDEARPIRQWRQSWPASLERLLERFRARQGETKGTREFLSVLLLYRSYSAGDVEAAVDLALESQLSTSDGVKHILLHSGADVVPPSLERWPATPQVDITMYQQLAGGR